MSQAIKESLTKIHIPSFNEYTTINESAKIEMEHYSALVDSVDDLKKIYGDKEIAKTGIIASLQKLNTLILTGKKVEEESQETQAQENKEAQAQAQPEPQPAAQTESQLPGQAQAQAQPAAQIQ